MQTEKKYQASNIKFHDDVNYLAPSGKRIVTEVPRDLKLIKIKGSLNCNQEEAEIILQKINFGETIMVSSRDINEMFAYGINCSYDTLENIEKKKKLEEERKQKEENDKKELARKTILANKWLETLSEEQKEYIVILSPAKYIACG